MTKLTYVVFGCQAVAIKFANLYDAQDVATQLLNCPGVVNIRIQDEGFKPYSIDRKSRYHLFYCDDKTGERWHRKEFSFLCDAAREGEQHTNYQIEDMFESRILYPADVQCLI